MFIVKIVIKWYNLTNILLGGFIMKLEQANIPSLFSSIEIPDIFFTEYLSSANSDYIKVYLYMLFLSKYDKEIKINDLSKKLVLPLKTIQDATKYYKSFTGNWT